MKRKIEHTFITQAHSLVRLFQGVNKMSTFMRRLEEEAQIDPDRYDRDKYVGDGFEFFVELFLYLHPCDNRVGVYDYQPTQDNDNGVDGIGVNIKGQKCVVQVKYRGNTQNGLTANVDHLSNMFSDGSLTYHVDADHVDLKNYRHFIFTTADGLNFYTDKEMYKSQVKCFGYQDFRSLLDSNTIFWKSALEICEKLTKDQRKD